MEVHPPDHPILTPRDFFVHLFTITVGLLIALGLEGLVEVAHHHHLLHTAEFNLHAELRENRKSLGIDEQQLLSSESALTSNIAVLDAIKSHRISSTPFDFHWYWSGMQTAAWDTARNTGAIALMPYDHAQGYSMLYSQQTIVDEQAAVYIHDIYRSNAPLAGGRKLTDLSPVELDAMIAATRQTLADLELLRDLCRSLDNLYNHADTQL